MGFLLKLNITSAGLRVLGWSMFILGSYIHYLSYKAHLKAHESIERINYIANKLLWNILVDQTFRLPRFNTHVL
ncbi:MAG: hypothetical protein B7O98_04645 [Zestosphaera tikiterensis]|uniref:Uncharacterized protein n=1 Tax=Zestosphaera tikiterensis TaxID=1973259 RepID=A0A2R7Y5F2_9CREN|nr:MAG: hypothetical protein B7O98_04645 [Zestosphaera tikiterensis]